MKTARVLPFPRPVAVIELERDRMERRAAFQEHVGQFKLAERTWQRVAELQAEADRAMELRLSASERIERMRRVMWKVGKGSRK